jgi:hypothetical protein
VHGLPRTILDKRRAVQTLLRDPEWVAWSDSAIARACHVSNVFVSKMRKGETSESLGEVDPRVRTYIHGLTGKETQMHVTHHHVPPTRDLERDGAVIRVRRNITNLRVEWDRADPASRVALFQCAGGVQFVAGRAVLDLGVSPRVW